MAENDMVEKEERLGKAMKDAYADLLRRQSNIDADMAAAVYADRRRLYSEYAAPIDSALSH